jgi:arylformamidase
VAALFVKSLGLLMTEEVRLDRMRVFPEPHKGTRGGPSDSTPDRRTSSGSRLVELSHPIVAGMTTYPGLPAPEISSHLAREASRAVYAEGTQFTIDRISMVGNTGTYIDSPWHRYADGTDLAELPLSSFALLDAVVARTVGSKDRAVDVGSLAALDVAGKAVLLHTGGDAAWGTPGYADDAPYLTEAAARFLVERKARLVGIDSVNIDNTDQTSGGRRPAHTLLLAAGIPIVEHLTGLEQLPPRGATFTAAPPRISSFGTFPVRAFAMVQVRCTPRCETASEGTTSAVPWPGEDAISSPEVRPKADPRRNGPRGDNFGGSLAPGRCDFVP